VNGDETRNDGRAFRWTIGLLCVVGSLLAFAGLYFIQIPKNNEQALLLALGYLFGWGSAVVQSEYGSTATGRKVAESAIRNIERQDKASADPTPANVQEAAQDTADAAQDKADTIKGDAP
jgi:hypothetical protein